MIYDLFAKTSTVYTLSHSQKNQLLRHSVRLRRVPDGAPPLRTLGHHHVCFRIYYVLYFHWAFAKCGVHEDHAIYVVFIKLL
jgi:hypothetical protein